MCLMLTMHDADVNAMAAEKKLLERWKTCAGQMQLPTVLCL